MAVIEPKWTAYGIKSLLQKGIYGTLKNFSVEDSKVRYDGVKNSDPTLSITKVGGSSTFFTTRPNCDTQKAEPISQKVPTEEQLQSKNDIIKFEFVSNNSDLTYTKNNLDVKIHLNRWLNYIDNEITNGVGVNTKLNINLNDYLVATRQQYNVNTSLYEDKEKYTNFSPTYKLITPKEYKKVNSKLMQINSGYKSIYYNSNDNKFPLPTVLYLDTIIDTNGTKLDSHQIVFSYMNHEVGYVCVPNEQKNDNITVDNWYQIREVEELNNPSTVFRSIKPAFKLTGGRVSDIYIMDSEPKATTQQGAGLFYAFENINGTNMLTGLKNLFLQNFKFHANQNTDGTYSIDLGLELINKSINGITYKNLRGGNLKIELLLDESDSTGASDYGSIVEVLN